ncbi:MAG: thiamine-phosphate kinase [Betaproteobacteria bacterium]
MPSEFDLIAKYFTQPVANAVLGVGDDCALIRVSPGCELAISTDTLVSGTHFFPDANAEKLGHKALAVNLSDLAAMGAKPRYVLLALTLPQVDEPWLAQFSKGFLRLARDYGVELIGGDTTRGPLSMTVTVMGEVEIGRALRRDGAQDGDDIWVSGDLGAAALALKHLKGSIALQHDVFSAAAERLHSPSPRVALGRALIGIATSVIDVSDGLAADLGHLCEKSGLSAQIKLDHVPMFPPLELLSANDQITCTLAGGDDYELCFTAPVAMRSRVSGASADIGLALTRIGIMRRGNSKVHWINERGEEVSIAPSGFDHFLSER